MGPVRSALSSQDELLPVTSTDKPLAMHDAGNAKGVDSKSGIGVFRNPASIGYV